MFTIDEMKHKFARRDSFIEEYGNSYASVLGLRELDDRLIMDYKLLFANDTEKNTWEKDIINCSEKLNYIGFCGSNNKKFLKECISICDEKNKPLYVWGEKKIYG